MDADLFESWFAIADQDHDGLVSGAEAVHFFQRSNLSQETLFQVWNLVAGDNSTLTKPQFYSTLRLISLAQRSGGMLPEAQARSLLVGIGPAIPPPTLAGLPVPRATVTQQTWQSAPQIPGAQQPARGTAGGSSTAFPPMPAADAQRYRDAFTQMDADRDGYILGAECFGFFMQWGLSKAVLKDIWDAVAGDEGRLSQGQFLSCLYLMDLAKRNIAPPKTLPPGPFPPIAAPTAAEASGSAAFSLSSVQQHDVFSQELPIPQLPGKAHFSLPTQPPHISRVPQADTSALNAVERSRLVLDQTHARELDRQLHQAQADRYTAQQKEEFYKTALQELTLFKSRTNAALLQAQERAEKEAADANAMQAQYEAAWKGAEATHSMGRQLLDTLTKARARKAEANTKLEQLQRDIAELSSLDPEQIEAEQEATRKLEEQIGAAEATSVKLEMQAAALRQEKAAVEKNLEEVQLSCAAGQADVAALKKDLAALEAKAYSLAPKSFILALKAEDSEAAADLVALLKSTADVYRTLLGNATRAGINIPPEALLRPTAALHGGREPLPWNDYAAVDADDWEDFEDEGFEIIGAQPAETPAPDADGGQSPEQQQQPGASPVPQPAAPAAEAASASHTHPSSNTGGFAVDFGDTASSSKGDHHATSRDAGFFEMLADIKPPAKSAQEGWAAF